MRLDQLAEAAQAGHSLRRRAWPPGHAIVVSDGLFVPRNCPKRTYTPLFADVTADDWERADQLDAGTAARLARIADAVVAIGIDVAAALANPGQEHAHRIDKDIADELLRISALFRPAAFIVKRAKTDDIIGCVWKGEPPDPTTAENRATKLLPVGRVADAAE